METPKPANYPGEDVTIERKNPARKKPTMRISMATWMNSTGTLSTLDFSGKRRRSVTTIGTPDRRNPMEASRMDRWACDAQ
jgi:hypothetical protein